MNRQHSLSSFPFSDESQFIRALRGRLGDGADRNDVPRLALLAGLINSSYSASQIRIEDRPVRPHIALANADDLLVIPHFGFSEAMEYSPKNLALIAASFPSENGWILATARGNKLVISGFCHGEPPAQLLLVDVLRPGSFVVRLGGVLVATVQPDGHVVFSDSFVREDTFHEYMFMNTSFGKVDEDDVLRWKLPWVLSLMAQSMRRHGRGGCALFVASDDATQLSSLATKYPLDEGSKCLTVGFKKLRSVERRIGNKSKENRKPAGDTRPSSAPVQYLPDSEVEREFVHALRFVASLTAVDGALVLGSGLRVHGYGAKIRTKRKAPPTLIECDFAFRCKLKFDDLGGMRHRSAAQFVYEHPSAGALVVSQDGPVTIFTWDDKQTELLAIRAELLVTGTYGVPALASFAD